MASGHLTHMCEVSYAMLIYRFFMMPQLRRAGLVMFSNFNDPVTLCHSFGARTSSFTFKFWFHIALLSDLITFTNSSYSNLHSIYL